MNWTTPNKKTEKQKQVDILEAAIVSAASLTFMFYSVIVDSPIIMIGDWVVTFTVIYSSYKISEYRKRIDKYRKGIKNLESVLDSNS